MIWKMGESVLCEASRRLKPAAPCLVRYSNINKAGGSLFRRLFKHQQILVPCRQFGGLFFL